MCIVIINCIYTLVRLMEYINYVTLTYFQLILYPKVETCYLVLYNPYYFLLYHYDVTILLTYNL